MHRVHIVHSFHFIKDKMLLVHLPVEIFRFIQSYINKIDHFYFLNSSKEYFHQLKRESLYFSLNIHYSNEYMNNPIFRDLLLSKIENGWKQISLSRNTTIDNFPPDLPVHRIIFGGFWNQQELITDFHHIEIVKGVTYTGASIPLIPQIKELTLMRCGALVDVSNLSHLSKLELIVATELPDITPLKNIPHLTLSNCRKIEDYSMFNGSKQRFLRISDSSLLTNVKSFTGIRQLILHSCYQLEDISPLKGIYSLTISSCSRVKDISGLGNHHRLAIENCSYALRGYDSLYHIPHIRLNACNISDMKVLQYATSVSLLQCSEITDVTPLKDLKFLVIDFCYRIMDITSLSNIPDLTLVYQEEIPPLNHLKNQKLFLEYYNKAFIYPIPVKDNLHYYQYLKNMKELIISYCDDIIQLLQEGYIEYFQHLSLLTIGNSQVLKHVNGLGDLPNLRILSCPNLSDINGLGGKNHYVELDSCEKIEDVSSLSRVPMVYIRYCKNIKDYDCLAKVERLKILK